MVYFLALISFNWQTYWRRHKQKHEHNHSISSSSSSSSTRAFAKNLNKQTRDGLHFGPLKMCFVKNQHESWFKNCEWLNKRAAYFSH